MDKITLQAARGLVRHTGLIGEGDVGRPVVIRTCEAEGTMGIEFLGARGSSADRTLAEYSACGDGIEGCRVAVLVAEG